MTDKERIVQLERLVESYKSDLAEAKKQLNEANERVDRAFDLYEALAHIVEFQSRQAGVPPMAPMPAQQLPAYPYTPPVVSTPNPNSGTLWISEPNTVTYGHKVSTPNHNHVVSDHANDSVFASTLYASGNVTLSTAEIDQILGIVTKV